MRISGTSGGSEITDSKKSAIERQIRKLEAKRDKILEKLGVKKASKEKETTSISKGTLNVKTGGSGTTVESGTTAVSSTESASSLTREIGQALRQIAPSAPTPAESDEQADPKELMKQLATIEAQIMSLRQQLNEDSLEAPEEIDLEEVAALATGGIQAREAQRSGGSVDSGSTPPPVEVSAFGTVDGYV